MDRWWRINRTLIEKLQDTGYEVPAVAVAEVASLASFRLAFPDAVADPASMERVFYPRAGTIAELRAPNGVLLGFGFSEGKHILTGEVTRLLNKLQEQNVTTCFYTVNKPVYHKAMEYIREAQAIYRIVVFRQEQLAFNISRHRRVPRHVLLPPAEASTWLATTQLKRSQLPRIFEDDPMAKYYDAQPTELMRVINPSPTVGSYARILVVVRRLVR